MIRALFMAWVLGLLLATSAAAQCSDCEKTHAACTKVCFADTRCRKQCEKELQTCSARCGPVDRSKAGGAGLIKQYEADCSGGEAKACFALGATYLRGREVSVDYEKALKYLEASCRDGQADACGMLGEMYLRPYGVAQDVGRGLSLMEKSCDRGSVEGCTALGKVLAEGKHKPKDIDRAMKLWREACGQNHPLACGLLGAAHLKEKHEPQLALEKLDRACALGDGQGCTDLCTILLGEQGVPREEKRAYSACEKGCADGKVLACTTQGVLLWYGDAVKGDNKRGRELLENACEGGDANACVELAGALESGSHGVKKDPEQAASNFLRASRRLDKECSDKLEARPCAQWATLGARGKVPQKDPVRIRSMLEKACSAEEQLGCAGLGLAQEELKEPKKALEAYQRGCDGHQAAACAGLGRLAPDLAKSRVALESACALWSGPGCLKLAELLKAEKAPPKEVKAMRAKACRYGAVEGCK